MALGTPQIQSSQVFFGNFGNDVYLTPATQGIHLPDAIFVYMDTQFFQHLCATASDYGATEFYDISQTYLELDECQCTGGNYNGMPGI